MRIHPLPRTILVFSALLSCATVARAAETADYWVTIVAGGSPAGYTHTTIREVASDGERLIETTDESVVRFMRLGQTVRVESRAAVTEAPDGRVRRIVFELGMSASERTRSEGVVAGSTLKVTDIAGARKQTRELPWNEQSVGPDHVRRQLAQLPDTAGRKLEFVTYAVDAGQFVTQTYEVLGREKIQVANGEQDLRKIKVTSTLTPGMPEVRWIDAEARLVRSEQDLIGMKWVSERSDRSSALASLEGEVKSDAILLSAIEVDQLLPNVYRLDEIVYRFTRKNPDVPLPELDDARQTSEPVAGAADQVLVRVRKCVPDLPVAQQCPLAPVPDELKEFLISSALLQSDDAKIIAAAQAAVGGEKNAWLAAQRLERFVHAHVTKKSFGVAFASAAEVLDHQEGDCSEHAVLLAALARAAGIPARLAIGVLYLQGKLAGHLWSEVSIDGEWYALDGTLGLGFAAASHVAFSKGSFNDRDLQNPMLAIMQMLGNLKGEVLEYRFRDRRVRLDQGEKPWRIEGDTYEHPVLGLVIEKPSDWTWHESNQRDGLVRVRDPAGTRIEVDYAPVGADLDYDAILQGFASRGKVEAKREREVAGRKALEILAARGEQGEHKEIVLFVYKGEMLYVFKARVTEEQSTRDAMEAILGGVSFVEG
jgi:hypothetical protein